MVDVGTWNRLDEAARRDFQALSVQFQESLRTHGLQDGSEFGRDWSVRLVGGVWAISDGTRVLEGVSSPRRAVIEALYADAVQNLNR